MTTGLSPAPLRLNSILGICSAFIALIASIYLILQIIILKLTTPEWAAIIVSALVIGAIQLLPIGVLGKYLGGFLLTLNTNED